EIVLDALELRFEPLGARDPIGEALAGLLEYRRQSIAGQGTKESAGERALEAAEPALHVADETADLRGGCLDRFGELVDSDDLALRTAGFHVGRAAAIESGEAST